MQRVEFKSFHRSGLKGQAQLVSLADLVRAMPYLMSGGFIPPRVVMNKVLARGEFELGMGGAGKWRPLELDENDYREVVADLVENGAHGRELRLETTPDWVVDETEWSLWVAQRAYSIPADENRRLTRAMNHLHERARQAASLDDEATRMECLIQLNDLASQYSDFVQRHRKAE